MKTCWRPFSYLIIHRQAAQDRLNAMAEQGWELEKIRFECLAKFRRTSRKHLRYFVDFTDPKPKDPCEESEYLRLCADAGWEWVEQMSYWNIYASAPDRDPAPIQTDPEVEYQRYRKKVGRRSWIGVAIVAAILAVYALLMLPAFGRPYSPTAGELLRGLLSSSLSLPLILAALPLFLLWGLVYLIVLGHRLRLWRRDVEDGLPLSAPSPRQAGVLGGVKLVCLLLIGGYFLLLPLDSLLNGVVNWGFPVGLLIGAAILVFSDRYKGLPQYRRRARAAAVFSVILLACMLFRGPARALFPGRLPPGPIVAGFEDDDPGKRTDGLLGSHANWWEKILPTEEEGPWGLVSVQAWTWTSDAAADWAFALEDLQGMEETAPGLWRQDWGEDQVDLLLRRGRTWVRVYWHGDEALDRQALAEALERYLER